MAFDLDPFDDILPETAGNNARAGAKFQPKAKPRSRKETHVTVSPSLPNAAKQKPVTTATIHQDPSPSVSLTKMSEIMPFTTTLTDHSPKRVMNQELVNSIEVFHPGFPFPEGDRNSAPVDISSQNVRTKEDVDSRDTLHSEVTISNADGDLQSGYSRSERETADIFSELESLQNILYESSTTNAVSTVRKFQPRVKVNPQFKNDLPTSCPVTTNVEGSTTHAEAPICDAYNAKDLDGGPSLLALSSVDSSTFRSCSFAPTDTLGEALVSQETINNRDTGVSDYDGGLLIDAGRLEREEEVYPGLESYDVISQTTNNGNAQTIPSETEYFDDDLTTATPHDGFVDFSTINLSHPSPADLPSKFPVIHHADAAGSNASMPQEVMESDAVLIISGKESTTNSKRKTLAASDNTVRKVHSRNVQELSQETLDERPPTTTDEGNETSKSSRRLRKRLNAPVLVDEMEDGIQENVDCLAEPSNNSLMEEDDYSDGEDEYREETSFPKRAPSKAKRAVRNEKVVRTRKKSSEGPDSLSKELPKKKFSHSTRRNRRKVDKVLLETPKEDIKKLIIKDLILLGEARERMLKKDAMASKKSRPSQSANNSFPEDAPYDEYDPFASAQGLNSDDDEATHKVEPNSSKHNYHSYMDKIPKDRWSKQDTERFYEAIRQFGTDFAMIQLLFPSRTRHQVKQKYKKEEREHPLKLHDALTNRSKDRSHFELVIEKLQAAAAQAEQNSDGDMESAGVSGEAEDNTPETNGEVANSVQKEEVANEAVPEVHNSVKSHHESEDDTYKWSPKSDYDDYTGY